ncbi:MAG: hypothetical protein DMF80_20325 [Acidobacteria bacterium]|nr:MAG: hypothetical protein DMF80_20325 [Acidobacteriota bacterium]
MRLASFHGRWRQRTSLLAMGALSGHEADDAQAHVSRCPACADELARLRRLRELAALDPLRRAEPPLGVSALLARVNARLDAEPARRPRLTGRIGGWLPAGALAASLLAALLLRPVSPPAASSPAPSAAAQVVTVPEQVLRRMERRVTREQTARYLDDAQDLLLTVTAPRPCPRQARRVDVEEEAERSRRLLARRALVIETGEDVASVRPVLRDVEYVLREVASLPSCARERDLQAIQREVSRRNLLMKIDLMTRELKG